MRMRTSYLPPSSIRKVRVREDGFSSLQHAQVERSMLRSSKKPFTIARPEAVAASLDKFELLSG